MYGDSLIIADLSLTDDMMPVYMPMLVVTADTIVAKITYTFVCICFIFRENSTAVSEMNGIELLDRVITVRVVFIQEKVECGLNDPRMHDCDQQ